LAHPTDPFLGIDRLAGGAYDRTVPLSFGECPFALIPFVRAPQVRIDILFG
jgi:hypothetical protein